MAVGCPARILGLVTLGGVDTDALPFQHYRSLELSEGAKHLEHELPSRCLGVNDPAVEVEDAKGYPTPLEFLHDGEELP
jgi:hypothetical protein